MQVSIVEMKPGQSGVISSVRGGPGFVEKLSHIGLHEGKVIKKISSVFSRGPVVRIMVEVNDDEKTCHGRES